MKHHYNLKSSLLLPGALLLGLAAALPARADYQSTVLSQNPLGYWQLNETTQPLAFALQATNQGSLGAPDNGAYNNSPLRGLAGPFTGSLAVQLDGLNQSITAPFDAAANPNAFSVELWVKPARVPNFAYVASSVHVGSPRSGWYLAQDNGGTFSVGSAFVVRMFYQNASAQSITLHAALDTNAPPSWYHLVLTYDGTTATLYTNGLVAESGAPLGYVANVDSQFSVGVRSDNSFYWPGQVAEVAMYNGALSSARVSAHYSTATTTPANYATAVTTDSPLIYWRFREPADPAAANLGSLGTGANGKYLYPAHPGVTGPVPATFQGFTSGNKAVAFDGTGGYVSLPPLNLNTNTVTITGWINASNAQNAATGLILSRSGTTVAGLTLAATKGLQLAYNWNNDNAAYNWAFGPSLPDSQWAFVALVVQPTEAEIYVVSTNDPTSWTAATNYISHPNQAFEGPTAIGTDTGFMTNRTLYGAIDEVAIFNRSLSAGEVYSQFAAGVGNLPPVVLADPQIPANAPYAGDALNLYVDAGGTPALSYQWRKDGVVKAGATTSTFSIASLGLGDSGNYDVVVTNNFGSVTSQVASITVNAVTSPVITDIPVSRTLFVGGVLNLKVAAIGGQLHYQWLKNTTPIPNATNPVYTVSSVTTADAGNYAVTVTNTLGSVTSSPDAVIGVLNPASGTYEATILADTPLSVWRLDETTPTAMFDAMGRNDGFYTNSQPTMGAAGVLRNDTDTAISTDGSAAWVGVVPYSQALASSDFALECWAKVPDGTANYCPVSFHSANKGGEFVYSDSGAGAWRAAIGAGNDPYLFYYLGDTIGANIVPNKWMHLVISYSAASGLRAYVNGQWNNNTYGNFPRNIGAPLLIAGIGSPVSYNFKGSVDEVAFYNHALSQAQVQAHYVAGLYGASSAPVFSLQPLSRALVIGQTATLQAVAEGTLPITLQWYKDGVLLPNQTNNALAIDATTFAAVGTYSVIASNSIGTTPSANAVITVSPLPSFANATNGLVLHLRFDGDLNDSSGRANNATNLGGTFVAGRIGSGAFSYATDTTNGTYKYATLGQPTDLLFSSNVNFSVSYWIQLPKGQLSGDLPFLCSAATATFARGITIAPTYKTGGWAWSLNGTGKYGADASINDGNWHNVVTLFDRAGSATTYLDGALVDSTPISSAGDVDWGNDFNIGQDPTGLYGESGGGTLDDLGIWRRLLTDAEASAIYYAGRNGTSFDTYGPVSMLVTPSGPSLIITWQAGTLLEGPTVNGPWTPVSGATPPNYKATPGPGNKFYRVQL